jgi:hypothetical protein
MILFSFLIALPSQAAVINVGGNKVKIANKYKKAYVEKWANICFSEKLPFLLTDAAVKAAAVSCTNEVLLNTYPKSK